MRRSRRRDFPCIATRRRAIKTPDLLLPTTVLQRGFEAMPLEDQPGLAQGARGSLVQFVRYRRSVESCPSAVRRSGVTRCSLGWTKSRSRCSPAMVSAPRTPSRSRCAGSDAFDLDTFSSLASLGESIQAHLPDSSHREHSRFHPRYRSNRPGGCCLPAQGSCCSLSPSSGLAPFPLLASPSPSIPPR